MEKCRYLYYGNMCNNRSFVRMNGNAPCRCILSFGLLDSCDKRDSGTEEKGGDSDVQKD